MKRSKFNRHLANRKLNEFSLKKINSFGFHCSPFIFFYCSIHLVFTTISFAIVSFRANKRAKRIDECSCFIISFHSCQLDSFAIWSSINAIFMVLAFEIQNPSGFFYWPEFCFSNRSYIESTVRSSLNPKRFDDSFHLIRK